MDIQFYGANCITLSNKQVRVVIDDTLAHLGAKTVTKEGDISLFTFAHETLAAKSKVVIDMAGEYEVSGVSIYGIQSRAHMDTDKQRSATMYKISWNDTNVLVTGHVFPKLSDNDLEAIGMIDVMLVPVGGNGYTLDAAGALQLIKQVEPKVVIPTHYADSALNYEVPQQELVDAIKTLGMEPKETTKKLQFKPGEASDTTQLVILEKA